MRYARLLRHYRLKENFYAGIIALIFAAEILASTCGPQYGAARGGFISALAGETALRFF